MVEAALALAKAGVLRRWALHEVANDSGKNLRECVRRIDGGGLGERLTEGFEWAGVLEQVAALGWTRLDLRCRAAPRTPHSPAQGDTNTVIICMILCLPPSLQDSLFHSLVQLGLQIRVILSCYDVGQPFSQWSSIGQRCG